MGHYQKWNKRPIFFSFVKYRGGCFGGANTKLDFGIRIELILILELSRTGWDQCQALDYLAVFLLPSVDPGNVIRPDQGRHYHETFQI